MGRPPVEKKVEEGVAPWLATFGDMITLVLVLFVLLYAFSSVDAVKWNRLVSSMSGTPFVAIQALDPSVVEPSSREEDLDDEPASSQDQLEHSAETSPEPTMESVVDANVEEAKELFSELFGKISSHINENNLETKLNVEMRDEFIILHITDSTLFSSGQAYLKPESKELLNSVSELFTEYQDIIKMIRIEGHTDDRKINNAQFKDNWDLSVKRATNVLRYFLAITDIENTKFSASGYGEWQPVATNETEEGRAQNRRVDFMIESIYASEYVDLGDE
jgi:chemotaxis protein MotB